MNIAQKITAVIFIILGIYLIINQLINNFNFTL
jgi:uncharacterized protein YoxC